MRYLLVLTVAALGCASRLHAGELTAGAAAVDITPPPGVPLAGYYGVRLAEGTLDPLFARALVLEKDGSRVALVALDLVTTTRPLVEEVRRLVEAETGIPGRAVMVSATHTHTGPEVRVGTPRGDLSIGGAAKPATDYANALPGLVAAAVRKADVGRKPARVGYAAGWEDGLAFNRRFHTTDGTVVWNPAKKSPLVVGPAGPTDPAVPVVLIETADGKTPIATYVNFAMHLDTVSGFRYSADLVAPLARCLGSVKGDGMLTLFTMGTAGDVNHRNVALDGPQKGPGEAARIGTRLAAEVLRTYDRLAPVGGPVRVSSAVVELPLPAVTDAEVAAAKAVVADALAGKTLPFAAQVEAFKVVDVARRLGKPHQAEVQVVSVGDDLAWVALPGEVFTSLGLAIKAGSPFRQTIVATQANGSVGYVPDRVAYPQGAYEVASARVAAGSGEMLVDAALKLLREQYREGKAKR
jgi:neutral ceramidase